MIGPPSSPCIGKGDWYWGWEKAIDLAETRKHSEAETRKESREDQLRAEALAQVPGGEQAHRDMQMAVRVKRAVEYRVQQVNETKPATLRAAMKKALP